MRIAVVGTGISGLTAAWLARRHHDVDVYEQQPRVGGHTNTVEVATSHDAAVPVDTGFIVHNRATYPLFTRLLDELGVATQASDMSWSLRCERCDIEYAGSPRGLIAQPRRLADPGHAAMVRDLLRFNRLARRFVDDPAAHRVRLGTFLHHAGFGDRFRTHYLLPMASAIWSSGTLTVEDFPLGTLLRFLDNHGLLTVTGHHEWRTVVGGSRSYLTPLTAPFAERIHVGDGVAAIRRGPSGVTLRLASGATRTADAVIVAAHADEALGMLEDPTRREKELLGAWTYSTNDTWLHTDRSFLPQRRGAWASWNYHLDDCTRPADQVSVSYHMNRLQRLSAPEDYLVTLNPARKPRPDAVLAHMEYTHPVFDGQAVDSQRGLDELNGAGRTFFAGAYHRYGFHEDGVWSAVRAVSHLGIRWPA